MNLIKKTKNYVILQAGEMIVSFNKHGVAWEFMLDKKGIPDWKKVAFLPNAQEDLIAEFLLSAGATRQHDGRNFVYNLSTIKINGE